MNNLAPMKNCPGTGLQGNLNWMPGNMFISYYVSLKCRGRVVTNVVRTCGPTPLLYIFGNKICLN